jgi:DNA-directed RNA polymerase II subunit RPB2
MIKTNIKKSWTKIISKYNNIIEYEDIESCNFLMISLNVSKLNENNNNKNKKIEYNEFTKINRYGEYTYVNYTHCDFHGWVMLGSTASCVPFSHHDYCTKNIVFFSQAKQSIGIYLTSYKDRMDISQVLCHPQIPLVTTKAMECYNSRCK